MTTREPTVALLGLFGSPNLGNEVSLAAFLANVRTRLPRARFCGIVPRQSTIREQHGVDALDIDVLRYGDYFWRVSPPLLRDALREAVSLAREHTRRRVSRRQLHGYGAVVVPGTGLIDDFGQGPFDLPMRVHRWGRVAAATNVPLHLVSIGVATVDNPLTRWLFRRGLKGAATRSFRDAKSRARAVELGIADGADRVTPDLAFSLPPATLPPRRPLTWPPAEVAFGVMGYSGWNRNAKAGEEIYCAYIDKVKAIITWLLQSGKRVRIVGGDTRADERPIRDLAATFGGAIVSETINDYRDLLTQLMQSDAVIASRFHNVLLAILLQRPVISIGYADKNDELMAQVGLQHYCQAIEALDVDLLRRQFTSLECLPEAPIAAMANANKRFARELDEQYDRLCETLS